MTPSRIRARLGMWNLAVFGLVLLVTITAAALSIARVSDLAIDRELQLGAARAATRMAHAWAESDRHERDDERRDEGHDRAPEEDEHDRLVHFLSLIHISEPTRPY